MIFGCLIYSFLLTIVSALLKTKNIKKIKYEERINTLRDLSSKYNLSSDLIKQLNNSINHNYKTWNEDKDELINLLPSSLKISIQLKIYEGFLQKFRFFEKISNINFILSLASKLRSFEHEKNKFLLQIGENIEEMYFISKGKIQLSINYKNLNVKLANISSGMSYGDILMYTYPRSPFNIITMTSCFYYTLKKQDFSELKFQYEEFINVFLKESYTIHYYIENKKAEAEEYILKNQNLLNFEEEYNKKISKEVISSLFPHKQLICKSRRKNIQAENFNYDLKNTNEDDDSISINNIISKLSNLKVELKQNKIGFSETSKNIRTNYKSKDNRNYNKLSHSSNNLEFKTFSKNFVEKNEILNNNQDENNKIKKSITIKPLKKKFNDDTLSLFYEFSKRSSFVDSKVKSINQNKFASVNSKKDYILGETKSNYVNNNLTIENTSKFEIIHNIPMINKILLNRIQSNIQNTRRVNLIPFKKSTKNLTQVKKCKSLKNLNLETEIPQIINSKKDQFINSINTIIENKVLATVSNNYLNDAVYNYVNTMAVRKKTSKRIVNKASLYNDRSFSFDNSP